MRVLILLGCPEPPVLIPSFIYLTNMLKKKDCKVFVSANPAALKLVETADPEKLYIKNVGFQEIDEGLKEVFEVDYIISFVHNDAGVSYTITYMHKYKAKTIGIVFGKKMREDLVNTLKENNVETYFVRAFHNPIPIVVTLKRILENIIFEK
ncbi:conserved protein of unknown function [Methanocaldococcus lauensis]|uniref:DUF1890 domain-containing protein n=1 Tax=Methanocaldococcus lauensis TaxID=2546128 RepID=A0A8D6PSJ6_9EURY|nr:DUF1890 domain-containing protein [Methanocaldococcus lauensis]CAB3289401.1 conserved protein of unknown function [Methanocaldococcus lauensis]